MPDQVRSRGRTGRGRTHGREEDLNLLAGPLDGAEVVCRPVVTLRSPRQVVEVGVGEDGEDVDVGGGSVVDKQV